MEVVVAVQSGTLLHALRVQLKRRVSARRGGDYNEVPQAIQKNFIFKSFFKHHVKGVEFWSVE
jgi:hypothetical protein